RAEISRELLAGGDWAVCTLNHQPYYDKPPLFHWLLALAFHCFGANEAAARLVPALATLATVLTTFALGRRLLGNRAAFLGALALLLMAGFAVTGRVVGLDGTFTFLVTGALLAGHEAVRTGRLRWPWWLASSALCGLGVLTKGPVAVVLVLPVLVHARLSAGSHRPTAVQLLTYLAGVMAAFAPWAGLVLARDPQLLYDFVVDHHLRRFAAGTEHDEPWWFYAPILAAGCLPW